jgi:epoxyqueuosine reductase QueG
MTDKATFSEQIKEKALSLGFSACGIAKARNLVEEEVDRLTVNTYLDSKYHGRNVIPRQSL